VKLNATQRAALKAVAAAKLALWAAAEAAEGLLDRDIDTAGDGFDSLCCNVGSAAEIDALDDDVLSTAFGLDIGKEDAHGDGG